MVDMKLYTNLARTKVNKSILSLDDQTLEEIVKRVKSGLVVTQKDIEMAYCNDLKNCLFFSSLKLLLENLFYIEHYLEILKEEYEGRVPDLLALYQNLSPTILRTIWSHVSEENNSKDLLEASTEAIRIAIEEEVYDWQEKLF